MRKFKQHPDYLDENGSGAIEESDEVFIRYLSANTEATVVVPTGARFALFQHRSQELWTRNGGPPLTVPEEDLDSQSLSLNPDIRYVSGVDTIRMISKLPGLVVVSFYG